MHKKLFFLISLLSNILANTQDDQSFLEQYNYYYRKLSCNTSYRKKIDKLPDHLKDACLKMGVNPDDIQVFQENFKDASYPAHCMASNIMLSEWFWTDFNEEEQKWLFAHELSHFKHNDLLKQKYLHRNIVDFQIGSSVVIALAVAIQIARKRLQSLPSVLVCSGVYMAANIAALYTFFKAKQDYELRANDEAGRAVGVHAAIPLLKESLWKRDNRERENILHRLRVFAEKLGFCEHGSYELRIERLKRIERELSEEKNNVNKLKQ